MPGIDIKVDDADMRRLERELRDIPNGAVRAASSAINKTAAKGKTRIGRRIAQAMSAKYGKIAKKIKVIRATTTKLVATIRIGIFRIPMIDTKQTPTQGGSYALGQTGPAVNIQNPPFEQRMISGHLGWFVRFGAKRKMTKGRYAGRMREPVKQIYADSPAGTWEKVPGMAAEELSALGDDLKQQIESQIDRFLK